MSENQQNDRQEDVLPDEPVGADGAESAEPVNGSCPERPADAPTQESVPEVTNPSSEASQTPEANTEPATRYRWTYEEQRAYDNAHAAPADAQKSDGKRRVWVYALIMTAVFALSFGILLAVLLAGKQIHTSPGEPNTIPYRVPTWHRSSKPNVRWLSFR